MPYDVTSYLKTDLPPVYDKDNPPTRMSEAIRMAVADVQVQEAAGIEYAYRDCAYCTAGAVMRRCGAAHPQRWEEFGPHWFHIMRALSSITVGDVDRAVFDWPEGFSENTARKFARMTHPDDDLRGWMRDMLALADRLEAEGS